MDAVIEEVGPEVDRWVDEASLAALEQSDW